MSVTSVQPAITKSAGARLRMNMAALRLSFTWLGVRKSLSVDQKAEAADTFGAEGDYFSAAKKLLDTKHPAYRAVTAIRTQAIHLWKGHSLPFPEAGIRLVKQSEIGALNGHFEELRQRLSDAVDELDGRYGELRSAARNRLGRLYNSADYPESLRGLFAMTWDFPSVEPPEYLRELSPELYQQEAARIRARFDEAVRLTEQAFIEEFSKIVTHLTERLSGQEDGKPKVFRDSAVVNLEEFFQRFRSLNIGSNEQLEQLVGQAERIVRGVGPQLLRDTPQVRQRVATQLAGVQSVLDGLLVDRPRRNLLRRSKEAGCNS